MALSIGGNLNAEDRIIKARVKLGKREPFFGYLVMSLQLHKKDENEVPTMGVDGNGNLYYNPKFVDKLNDEELKGILCHEVMHCALDHMGRKSERHHKLWNIANDIIINDTILESNLTLPPDVFYPEHHELEVFGHNVTEIHEKSSEEIYDELYQHIKKEIAEGNVSQGDGGFDVSDFIDGPGKNDAKKQFDEHIKSEDSKPNESEPDIDWEQRFTDAATHAKMQGSVPAGIERMLGDMFDTKMNWRNMLYKYITNQLPFDFTWSKPHKKSRALGIYLPDVTKESIDIVVDIDTSGSISEDELQMFLSEVLGIIGSFQNVNLTILWSDCDVYGPYTFQNPQPEDVMDLKPEGGGGTDHIVVYDFIQDNLPQTKLLINFTDGYTSFPDDDRGINTIWVVAGNWHCEEEQFPFGEVVTIPRE
jgi:predicted metal-dependent peptidase